MSKNPPSATSNIRLILVPDVTFSKKHSSAWASMLMKYAWPGTKKTHKARDMVKIVDFILFLVGWMAREFLKKYNLSHRQNFIQWRMFVGKQTDSGNDATYGNSQSHSLRMNSESTRIRPLIRCFLVSSFYESKTHIIINYINFIMHEKKIKSF